MPHELIGNPERWRDIERWRMYEPIKNTKSRGQPSPPDTTDTVDNESVELYGIAHHIPKPTPKRKKRNLRWEKY